MKNRARKRRAQTTFTIRTARGNQQYHCARKPQEISEFRKSLELNPSKETESIIRVGDWVWVQYVTEGGEVDNNLALAVAILRYKSGSFAVALLWGKITKAGWDGGPQRVVCTDDCQVVDKESVGGRVIEPEKCGRILTENSVGAKFSLDRYHVSSDSYGNLERLEFVSFETEGGRPSERFLQEVTLAEGSPMDVQSPVQPSLLSRASEQEQLEVRDGNTTKELWPKKQDATTGTPSRLEPPLGSMSKSRSSVVEDGELVAGADVDADEKKDSDASVQADSEADAETGMADTTANTEAAAEADGAAHARSGIETDTETGVRSDFCAIVDVGGIGKTWVNAETDADEDAVADGEADGKESAADTEADTDADAVTNTGVETDVETRPEPDARVETDVHADTEPKRAGNIGSHAKAAAGLEAAQVAKSTTVTAGVPRANGDDVGTVCAGEWSSASRKRICNDTSNNDQPPKRARVAGSPATSQSEEKMPSKAYLTNKNAIDSRNLGKSQPLSTPDEGRAVKEREKDLLYARYDLQRMLLRKTSAPSELDVSTAGELLTSLKLRPDLEWDLIQATRIYKALKKVRDLSSIPGDQGDALRTRCATLLDVWESRRRVDSGTPSTTDQESMTRSEVVDEDNASKSENGHDMREVRTASVDHSA